MANKSGDTRETTRQMAAANKLATLQTLYKFPFSLLDSFSSPGFSIRHAGGSFSLASDEVQARSTTVAPLREHPTLHAVADGVRAL